MDARSKRPIDLREPLFDPRSTAIAIDGAEPLARVLREGGFRIVSQSVARRRAKAGNPHLDAGEVLVVAMPARRSAAVRRRGFRFDPATGTAVVDGRAAQLRSRESAILSALISAKGRFCSRTELIVQCWPRAPRSANGALSVYIHALRSKLESDPSHPRIIVGERGYGYRFALER